MQRVDFTARLTRRSSNLLTLPSGLLRGARNLCDSLIELRDTRELFRLRLRDCFNGGGNKR